MNAALFMLTSAFVAGADPAPAAPVAPAPAVVSTGSSCGGGCGTVCDEGCGKHRIGLWSRLKARFSKHSSCGCEAAPACEPACKAEPVCKKAPIVHCKPAPVCKAEPVCKAAPTCGGCASACDSGCGHVGLWSRVKGKFGKHGSASCDTCDSGCASTVAAPAMSDPVPAPKELPKKEMPKDLPKGGVTNLNLEPILTPVAAPKQAIEINSPANPF